MGKSNYFRLVRRALHEALTQGTLTAAVLVGTFSIMTAHGELVFETNTPTAVPSNGVDGAPMTREAVHEDRQNLRQVLNTSQKAEATNRATAQVHTAQIPQAQPQMVPQQASPHVTTMVAPPLTSQVPPQQSLSVLASVSSPADAQAAQSSTVAGTPEVQNLSKAELMRRERVREELRNEDILQERLEELRLRDEKRRTDQMVGPAPLAGASTVAETTLPPIPVVAEERVGAMATMPSPVAQPVVSANRPVVVAQNTQYAVPNGAPLSGAPMMQAQGSDHLGMGQASTSFVSANTVTASEPALSPEEKTAFWVTPKFGVSNMAENDGLNTQGRYSAGIGFGVGVSENMSFDFGYQFSEFGVGLSNSNPYYAYQPYGYNSNTHARSYKQNVVDAGIKLHFLGSQAKVRPFVGGGGAWSKSFLNYDQTIVRAYNQMGMGHLAQDYEVSSFLGYLSTGLDIKLSKSVSLGATFKYYRVMSAQENQNLSYYGLSNYGVAPNSDNATVGGSLARQSFYSILAGVSFQF